MHPEPEFWLFIKIKIEIIEGTSCKCKKIRKCDRDVSEKGFNIKTNSVKQKGRRW